MVAQGPLIDGSLSDPVWQSATVADGFRLKDTGTAPSQPTTVRFLCDGKRLYLGVCCAETQPEGMKVNTTPSAGRVWDDDFFEILIDVTNAKGAVETLGMTAAGVMSDDPMAARAQVAAARDKREWRLEVGIDLRDLGVSRLDAPVRWGLNMGRERHNQAPTEEVSSWNGAPGSVDDPELMGEIIIGPEGAVAINGLEIPATRWGAGNPLALRVSNHGAPVGLTVIAKPVAATGAPAERTTTTIAGSGVAQGRYTVAPPQASQRLGISVSDESGRVLYRLVREVEAMPLLALHPVRPNYRGFVMPQMETCEFQAQVNATDDALGDMTLEMQVRAAAWSTRARLVSRLASEAREMRVIETPAGEMILGRTLKPQAMTQISFPADAVPAGDSVLWLRLNQHGRPLAQLTMPLRRLAAAEVEALAAYVDEHNRLVVGGKPLFALGWYNNSNLGYLREIAQAGVYNIVADYGLSHLLPPQEQIQYLTEARAAGMWEITCPQSDMDTVARLKDHPALLSWYLYDEPNRDALPGLAEVSNQLRAADPDHPVFLVHFNPDRVPEFASLTDIMGFDHYPVPGGPLTRIAQMTDSGIEGVRGVKPFWMILQAFGWYQFKEPEIPGTPGGTTRLPTENELRSGRAPTRDESRCMTYLALTHGAQGLLYYSYYEMHDLPQYPEMWEWMKEIGAEVKELSPALLSTVTLPVQVRGDAAKLHALLKEHEGKWYLLTVNGEPTPARGEFVLPGAAAAARVLFEEREARVAGRVLADDFAPYAARVYEITPAGAR